MYLPAPSLTPRCTANLTCCEPAAGLKLLDVLNTLRKEARPGSQLQQELEAFDDQREQDGAELAPGCSVDLNSPLDVFYSVYDMVRRRLQYRNAISTIWCLRQ